MLFRIGDIEIDEARRQIRRGGRSIPVEPKVFDLILYLIRHRERVVSKHELLDALWPDQDVFEGALSVCVHRARNALGDPRGGRLLKTFARRGYRFLGGVEHETSVEIAGAATVSALPLLGRQAEMLRIDGEIEAVGERGVQMLLVAGDGGIGKTRLLQEAARHARRRGFEVLWSDGTGAPQGPFCCWREILCAYAAVASDEQVRAALLPEAEALREIAPELGERLRLQPQIDQERRPYQRTELFAAAASFLRRLASDRPLLLVFDDLHLADADSIGLLEFLLQSVGAAPLLVLASYGDAEIGPEQPIRKLVAAAGSRTISLHPLTDDEVKTLVGHLAGGTLSDEVAAAVAACAAGNPLFAIEYWRFMEIKGLVVPRDGSWILRGQPRHLSVPVPVRNVVRDRCAQLPKSTRRALGIAALIGRQFQGRRLAKVSGVEGNVVDEILRGAVRARLVSPIGDRPDTYAFSHALLQDELLRAIPVDERAAAHRRLAAILEEEGGPAAQAASHWVAGVDAGSAERAVRSAEAAGLEAFGRLGFDEAARWLDCAAMLVERHQPEDGIRRAQLLIGAGEALIRASDESGARRRLQLAVSMSPAPGAPESTESPGAPVEVERLLAMMRAAMEVSSGELTERHVQETRERERAVSTAIEGARARGDVALLATNLVSRRWMGSMRMPGERQIMSTEAVLLAEQVGLPGLLQEARILRIHDLLENGRIAEADAESARFRELAGQLDQPVYHWIAAYTEAMRARLVGRVAEAERLAQEAASKAGVAAADLAFAFLITQLLGVRAVQGRMAELVGMLEMFAERYPNQPVGHANLASVYCELDREHEARRHVGLALKALSNAGDFTRLFLPHTAAGLARTSLHLEDRETAAAMYEGMLPWSGALLVAPPAVMCIGPADGYLGPLAVAAGRWPDAERHFQAAIAECERVGDAPVCAHVQYEYARAILKRCEGTEQTLARSLLAQATATARELQLSGLLAWIEALPRPA